MTDQDARTYAFEADIGGYAGTDTRVGRTLPIRLSDWVNVKDWGATGIGDLAHDDTDAINAAIEYACRKGAPVNNLGGATVFFPPGRYRISKGGTVPLYTDKPNLTGAAFVTFQGSGRDVTTLIGNYNPGGQQHESTNGFLVQVDILSTPVFTTERGSLTCGMRDLTIHNENLGGTSGALLSHGSGNNRFFVNCHFIGVTGFCCTERSFGVSVRDCIATCVRPITPANLPVGTRSPYYTPANFPPLSGAFGSTFGSVGFYFGGGFFSNCHATGFDIGLSLMGAADSMRNCSATQCGIGITFGIKSGSLSFVQEGGEGGASPPQYLTLAGGEVISCVFNRCTQAMQAYHPTGLFAANVITGTTGPNIPAPIQTMTWNSSTHDVVVTTVDDHNLPGAGTLQIAPVGWTSDPDGFADVSLMGAKTFHYLGPSTAPPSLTGLETWNYPLQYGINCLDAGACLFAANVIEASVSRASFVAEGGRDNINNEAWCTRGPYGWSLASQDNDPYAAGCWNYEMCGGGPNLTRPAMWRFPGIPYVKYIPGQQNNIAGNPTFAREVNLIAGIASPSALGDVISAYLILSTAVGAGATILQFASVPSFIDNTFKIDNFQTHTGTNKNAVVSTTLTTVTIFPGTTAPIEVGSRIYFHRLDGGGGAYKIRYDGEAWRRMA